MSLPRTAGEEEGDANMDAEDTDVVTIATPHITRQIMSMHGRWTVVQREQTNEIRKEREDIPLVHQAQRKGTLSTIKLSPEP